MFKFRSQLSVLEIVDFIFFFKMRWNETSLIWRKSNIQPFFYLPQFKSNEKL